MSFVFILSADTRAGERCLPRRITPRSNMTPSACSARIREKHAISRSDTLQIHSARNTNSNGQPTNDQADLQQVHRASERRHGHGGIPEPKVNPSDPTVLLRASPLYDAAKFQSGNAEFNGSNCISGGAVHGTLYSAGGEQHAVVMVRGNSASPIVDVKGIGATFASHTADPD